MLTKLNW